jgi:membrane-associated phospholipid phosphatase
MFVKDLAWTSGTDRRAWSNSNRLVALEERMHLFIEPRLQDLFMSTTWLIKGMNLYYTTAHFLVTVAVLVWLFLRRRAVYGHYRTILLFSSMVALVGYFAFPLAPPRLHYCDCIVDTLDVVGGSWSYYTNQIKHVANPFAAMPSVHMLWALWVAWVVHRQARRRWARAAGWTHAAITLVAIVVTGNHYWLDAVGGAAVLVLGAVVVVRTQQWWRQRSAAAPAEQILGVPAS